jgi:hypothetical protein
MVYVCCVSAGLLTQRSFSMCTPCKRLANGRARLQLRIDLTEMQLRIIVALTLSMEYVWVDHVVGLARYCCRPQLSRRSQSPEVRQDVHLSTNMSLQAWISPTYPPVLFHDTRNYLHH